MNLDEINPECFILALFIRDDGERFLLGSGAYVFKDSQQHFEANSYANDIVEVQGNDGVFLAGQVRRPTTQPFDGYIGDATVAKEDVEQYRRDFLAFFRKDYYYTAVYIFPNGEAIQRRKGFIVDAPEVKELYQFYPEYHIALNFEDINYYSYSEDESGQETYTKSVSIPLASGTNGGGLIWDEYGAVSYGYSWITPVEIEGSEIEITNSAGVSAPLESVQLKGDTEQTSYSGKNLISLGALSGSTTSGVTISYSGSEVSMNGTSTGGNSFNALASLGITLPAGTYTASLKILSGSWTYPSSPSDADFALYILDAANVSSSHRLASFAGRGSSTWWGRSTFTLSEATTLYFYGTFNTAGIVFSNLVMGFQIEQGSTASTTYEPYTGGPAPNPDYPQPINVVTGEQVVKIDGENLFNVFDLLSSSRVTVDSDGWMTCTIDNASGSSPAYGTYFTNNLPALQTSTTYAIVMEVKSVSGTGTVYPTQGSASLSQFTSNIAVNFSDVVAGGVYVYTQSTKSSFSGTTQGLRNAIAFEAGQSGSITFRMSVLADTSVTPETFSYMPYQSQSYEVNLGKNRFNFNNGTLAIYQNTSNTSATYDDNNITMTAIGTTGSQFVQVEFDLDPTKTYTISGVASKAVKGTDGQPYLRVTYVHSDNGSSWSSSVTGFSENNPTEGTEYPFSFQISGHRYYRVRLYNNTNTPVTLGEKTSYNNVQIEEGSTATTYAPYFEPIELCKIGDYQDYIYKSGDDWYIHKEIGKAVLDGTESWYLSGNPANYLFNTPLPLALAGIGNPLVSDKFIWSGSSSASQQNVIYINSSGRIVFINPISDGTTIASNVDDWKTWLASHNTHIYYVLATPTDTQITNSALISQLDALAGVKLAVGENSIAVTAAGSNLPAILDLWYYTQIDYSGAGYEWEEGSGAGPVTVMVESIDRVYPVWKINGPAVNPQLSVITTGTILSYAGTVSASQTLEIDMFAKTAKLNGTSVIGNVSGDWAYFSPGNNRVVYTTQNADAEDSTIYWQEIVG